MVAAAHASAAAGAERRVVMVQFTELAPGYAGKSMRERGRQLWNRTPADALGQLLRELKRRPAEITPFATQMGEVALLAEVQGRRWPLAFIWEGLTPAEAADALADLAAEGGQ